MAGVVRDSALYVQLAPTLAQGCSARSMVAWPHSGVDEDRWKLGYPDAGVCRMLRGKTTEPRTFGVFVLVTGTLLVLVGSLWPPVDPRVHHGWWMLLNVCVCLVAPVLLLILTGRNVRNYGLTWGQLPRTALWLAIGLPLVALMALMASQDPGFRQFYPMDIQASRNEIVLLRYLLGSVVYMFAWEFAFRGYLTFGLYRAFGWWGIPMQATVFGLAHIGKLPIEVATAFLGGAALGIIALHTKSFVAPFVLHSALFITLNALVVYR